MCTPCALRQKIGFIKKTEELVRFFGPVVSGHWVMWRDGEGLGLEGGEGGWSETEWRRQHPRTGAHHSLWHVPRWTHGFCHFALLQQEQAGLVTESDRVTGQSQDDREEGSVVFRLFCFHDYKSESLDLWTMKEETIKTPITFIITHK